MEEGEVWGFTHEELIELLARNGFTVSLKRPFSWRLNHLYVFERSIDRGSGGGRRRSG
jgi:hypothetical protein